MSSNPYQAPGARVGDVETPQEYQDIRLWSAGGRVGRLRYLAYTTGASLLCGILAAALTAVLGASVGAVLTIVAYLVLVVFSVIIAIQRSHDMDWSGWTVLLTIIPFVALIWVFKRGSDDANNYGAPPPPNTLGVKILGLLLPIVFFVGILAAIAIPAYVEYTRRMAGS
jgi:uncharacterized membrane protein YhaH (DUF805 family)